MKYQQVELPPTSDAIVVDDKDVQEPAVRQRRMTLEQQVDEKQSQRMRVERLDFRNDENKTPLHVATTCGHME